jgi:hypothetical protein
MLVLSRVIPKLRAVWVVVAVTLFYASPSSSIGNRSIQETKSTPSASLILTTAITGQTYCSNGNVQRFLRLKFTNSGTETIILQKYSVLTTGYSVSRSRLFGDRVRPCSHDLTGQESAIPKNS